MLKEFGTFSNLTLSAKQQSPECSTVYFVVAQGQVLYVGLATNLRNRWRNHHRLPQLKAVDEKSEVKILRSKGLEATEKMRLPGLFSINFYCMNCNYSKLFLFTSLQFSFFRANAMNSRTSLLSYTVLIAAFFLPSHFLLIQEFNASGTHLANQPLDVLKNETIESDLPF